VHDRVCRDCETRYTPPTPIWMAIAGLLVGLVILSVGAAIGTFAIVDGIGQRPQDLDFDELMITTVGATVGTVALVAIGGTAVVTSVQHFRKGNDEIENQTAVPGDGKRFLARITQCSKKLTPLRLIFSRTRRECMSDSNQPVSLGCGTLFLTALIVLIFSKLINDKERKLRNLRSDVQALTEEVREMRKIIDTEKAAAGNVAAPAK
jgi:hypothetical protein